MLAIKDKLTNEERRYCAELYEQYRGFMYSTAKKLASAEVSAEDIVQNAAYMMAKYCHRFRDLSERAGITYIKLIVDSASSDCYRRRGRDARILDRYEEEVELVCPSAESDYMKCADIELLEKAINSLDARDRTLLVGKFYLRLSDAELAEMVGCKPDSVRTLVKRAKERAKKILIKEGFGHD